MSISSEVLKVGPTEGDGASVTWPGGTMQLVDVTDLRVVHSDGTTLVDTDLVLTTDYTVAYNSTTRLFTVTTVATYPAGEWITLMYNVPADQDTNYGIQGPYNPEQNESDFDLQTTRDAEYREKFTRALLIPLKSTSDPADLVAIIEELAPGGILTMPDDEFIITGSGDALKKLRFEADTNITSGQTRVLTMADRDLDLATLRATSSGLAIGMAAVHTNGLAVLGDLETRGTLRAGSSGVSATADLVFSNVSGIGTLQLTGALAIDSSVAMTISSVPVVTTTGSVALSNKTLTAPIIAGSEDATVTGNDWSFNEALGVPFDFKNDGAGSVILSVDSDPVVLESGSQTLDNKKLGDVIMVPPPESTIATGVVTLVANSPYLRIDTESDAATDDLDTITATAGDNGRVIYLRAENAARTVVVKNGTGNILLDGSDFTLDDTNKVCPLIYDSTLSKWLLLGSN